MSVESKHKSKNFVSPVGAKESLADQAYTLVEEMIITIQLEPGTVFSEGELSRKTGIGRTPLREALQRLEKDRLVVPMPRRGILVSRISLTQHLAILETRRVLDRLIASRAARRSTDDQRREIARLALSIVSAAGENDIRSFMRIDREADSILGEASRNPIAATACAPLHTHSRRLWFKYQNGRDLAASAGLHAAVLDSVARGDEEQATNSSDTLIDYLEKFTRKMLDDF